MAAILPSHMEASYYTSGFFFFVAKLILSGIMCLSSVDLNHARISVIPLNLAVMVCACRAK